MRGAVHLLTLLCLYGVGGALVFGAFAKFRKGTVSLVMSVRMEELGS
jgi:hypothetical protein